MNREGVPGKSPEEMYIQQKVRVLLMLRKMGSNLTASEEEFLRTYAGVVNSQLSQLPQHSIDQAFADPALSTNKGEVYIFWAHLQRLGSQEDVLIFSSSNGTEERC
ncbi:beta-catenin-interacting protein 1 isoform X2 [Emydura macquarii macquarii]|uniref:beta-catenin-interacting protein 1 isoform X2 n=1 Tax=Emydura macquarii macquarii TaxID=1129001 RepID=UPI00352A373A